MTAKKKSDAPGALALIEEAMHMLRLAPIGPLARYYIGTLPFVLGLLYFWADMSRDPYASRYCSIASAGLAFLYVWMKTWQSAYTRALGNVFFGRSPGAWSLKSALAAATKQAAIHSTGPLVFPVALLMTLPFAWVFAFYQNATVLDKGRGQGLRKLCRDAWKQAALAPAQNHLLLCVLFLFEFFVFLNLTAALFMAPHLLKQLIGIETVFTLSGGSAFNTTFLAVVFGLTHLCVDPILKAVYALRCFYGASIKSGDDIRASLKRCMTTAALLAPVLFSFTIIPSAHAAAGEPAGVVLAREGDAEAPLVSRRLNDSIERVLKRREFAWRAPRDKTPEEEPDDDGMIAQALAWLGDVLSSVLKTLGRWWDAFMDWLDEVFPEHDPEPGGADWAPSVRTILYLIGLVLVLALGGWLLRLWIKRNREETARPEKITPAIPDLLDEGIEADALPTNRWLELAKELMDKRAFRRGLRALYLAILAHLAEHGRITIAKYKSNREYRQELARRAHAEPELLTLFSGSVASFERAWYGMYTVTREDLDEFIGWQERIMGGKEVS